MDQYILTNIQDHVAIVTINRPEAGNSVSGGVAPQLVNAIQEMEQNAEVGAIVITGAGNHFCVGGDIKAFKKRIEKKEFLQKELVVQSGNVALAIRRCSKPVIAMVNGAATGAGCSIVLACDFRIVEPRTKLIMSFSNLALSGDTGSMYFLSKLVGAARTTEMMMRATVLSGEVAMYWGLANQISDPGKLLETTMGFAMRLANGPRYVFARQKELINQFVFPDLEEYLDVEADAICSCAKTEDYAEAVDAFLEKRPPVFHGK